jgi:DNA-binding beta-propeller fold protein YncE
VSGLIHPAGIAVDPTAGKVYWTDLDRLDDGQGSIQRSNLDGSDVQTLLSGIDEADGLAIDLVHGRLYWPEATTHSIESANLDGTDFQTVIAGLDNPTNVALDAMEGKLYWTSSGGVLTNQIDRANLDGTQFEALVAGVGAPFGIAVAPEPSSILLLLLGAASLVHFAVCNSTYRASSWPRASEAVQMCVRRHTRPAE